MFNRDTLTKTTSVALLGAIALASPVHGATSAELIAQLGGDDWTARQAAEDALVAQGAAVIDDLNSAMAATGDAELHARLASAIARINREQMTSATLVTMDKTFDRPIDALRAIANFVGLQVLAEGDDARPLLESPRQVHVACKNTPFVQALLNTAADSGVSVRMVGENIVVLPKPANEGRPIFSGNGALALVAESARHTESIDTASGRHFNGTYITLMMYAEPKLQLAPGSVMMAIKKLVDERDRPLQLRQMQLMFNHQPDGRWSCLINIPQLDPPSEKIAHLDLELLGNIVVHSDSMRIDDFTSLPKEIPTASGPVALKSISAAGDGWTMVLSAPPQRLNPVGGFRPPVPLMAQLNDPDIIRVTDNHGRILGLGQPQISTVQGNMEIMLPIALASPDDPPKRIEVRLPAQTREMRTSFSLSNLPLP